MKTHRFAVQVNHLLNVHAYFDVRFDNEAKILHVLDLDKEGTRSVTSSTLSSKALRDCMQQREIDTCLLDVLHREQSQLAESEKWELIDCTCYLYGTDGCAVRFDLEKSTFHPLPKEAIEATKMDDWLAEMQKRKDQYK